jgi:hypothetical protein
MDLIDKAIFQSLYRSDAKRVKYERLMREKTHPTVCDCKGGCDLGIAFSQD